MKQLTELNYPHFEIKAQESEYGKVLLLNYAIDFLDDEDLEDGNLTVFKHLAGNFIDPNRFTENELHELSMHITELIKFMFRQLSKRGYIKTFETPEEYKNAVKEKKIAYASRKKKDQ